MANRQSGTNGRQQPCREKAGRSVDTVVRRRPRLSPRQREIMDVINAFVRTYGCGPPLLHISGQVGLSRGSVWRHVRALRDKRRITWLPGRIRTIRPIEGFHVRAWNGP